MTQIGIEFIKKALAHSEQEQLSQQERYAQQLLADLAARIATETDNYFPPDDRMAAQAAGVSSTLSLGDLGRTDPEFKAANQLVKLFIHQAKYTLDQDSSRQARRKLALKILLQATNIHTLLRDKQLKADVANTTITLITKQDLQPQHRLFDAGVEGRFFQATQELTEQNQFTLEDKNYTVERLLGRGGMADVYLVSVHHGQLYAMKLALANISPEQKKLFHREANRLNEASRATETVPQFHAYYNADKSPFNRNLLLMEYIQGKTLHALIYEQRLKPRSWQKILVPSLLALSEIHNEGKLLLGDIKPKNIILTDDHRLVYLDLGCAVRLTAGDRQGQKQGTTALSWGTMPYAPPELHQGKRPTEASDIYQWAVTMLELIVGDSDQFEQLTVDHMPLNLLVIDPKAAQQALTKKTKDKKIADWLSKALKPRPEERYAGINDMMGQAPPALLENQPELEGLTRNKLQQLWADLSPEQGFGLEHGMVLILATFLCLMIYGLLDSTSNSRPAKVEEPAATSTPVIINPPTTPPAQATQAPEATAGATAQASDYLPPPVALPISKPILLGELQSHLGTEVSVVDVEPISAPVSAITLYKLPSDNYRLDAIQVPNYYSTNANETTTPPLQFVLLGSDIPQSQIEIYTKVDNKKEVEQTLAQQGLIAVRFPFRLDHQVLPDSGWYPVIDKILKRIPAKTLVALEAMNSDLNASIAVSVHRTKMITIYNQPSTDQSASNQNREQIFKPDQSFSASYLVRNQDGELFWYLPDLDGFVAFTDCPIYQALAGKETTYFYNSDGPWGANTP